MYAERLMTTIAVIAFLIILYWVRKRELREKYAVAWIGVSLSILIIGLFPIILSRLAFRAQISFATASLLLILGPLVFFAFSVSVSLSRAYRKTTRHTQEIALLEKRIRELEKLIAEAKGEGQDESDS